MVNAKDANIDPVEKQHPVNNPMGIWELVNKTDVKNTKEVAYGSRKFTAIDAYSQIQQATNLRGPYGTRWGFKDLDITENADYVILSGIFYYPLKNCTDGDGVGAFPIWNNLEKYDSKGKLVNDLYKKIQTDTLTKCLSYLWFNADVFLGQFVGNKYVGNDTTKQNNKKETTSNWPKKSHVSGIVISDKVAEFSRKKFDAYLTMEEQDLAADEYTGLKGKALVDAMKLIAGTTHSPTTDSMTSAPQNTAVPTEKAVPTIPAGDDDMPF